MLVGKRSFERHQANRGVTQGLDNRLSKKSTNKVFEEQVVKNKRLTNKIWLDVWPQNYNCCKKRR